MATWPILDPYMRSYFIAALEDGDGSMLTAALKQGTFLGAVAAALFIARHGPGPTVSTVHAMEVMLLWLRSHRLQNCCQHMPIMRKRCKPCSRPRSSPRMHRSRLRRSRCRPQSRLRRPGLSRLANILTSSRRHSGNSVVAHSLSLSCRQGMCPSQQLLLHHAYQQYA